MSEMCLSREITNRWSRPPRGYLWASKAIGGGSSQSLAIALNTSYVSVTCKFRGSVPIGGFSLGLASAIATLGLAAVYGRQWLEKAPLGAGIMQQLSVISALATVCIGLGRVWSKVVDRVEQ
ncbi:MAG: hypothetical protein AB4352_22650 [Hormoscilla sp.]